MKLSKEVKKILKAACSKAAGDGAKKVGLNHLESAMDIVVFEDLIANSKEKKPEYSAHKLPVCDLDEKDEDIQALSKEEIEQRQVERTGAFSFNPSALSQVEMIPQMGNAFLENRVSELENKIEYLQSLLLAQNSTVEQPSQSYGDEVSQNVKLA